MSDSPWTPPLLPDPRPQDGLEIQDLPENLQSQVAGLLGELRDNLLTDAGIIDSERRIANGEDAWGLFETLKRNPSQLLQEGCRWVPKNGLAQARLSELRRTLGNDDARLQRLLSSQAKHWLKAFQGYAPGLRPKSEPPPVGSDHRLPPQEQKLFGAVCSDVHLGTGYSNFEGFYKWLRARKEGETVVLLGDILDFWICTRGDKQADLVRRSVAEWKRLWKELAVLRDRGVEIHYVPGNHDGFVFFVEAADQFDWAQAILARSPEFQRIREETADFRLTRVASIDYPCFQMGEQKVLLTHGHYDDWFWQLFAGVPEIPPKTAVFLTTASVVFLHKHARIARRLNNIKDVLKLLNGLEPTAISITNALLRAYDGACAMAENDPTQMAAVIDNAMALHFAGSAPVDEDEEIKIRTALLSCERLKRESKELPDLRRKTMDFLREAGAAPNYCLPQSPVPGADPIISPLEGYARDDGVLVIGHHHKPRDSKDCFDVGGFCEENHTTLAILTEGVVYREG